MDYEHEMISEPEKLESGEQIKSIEQSISTSENPPVEAVGVFSDHFPSSIQHSYQAINQNDNDLSHAYLIPAEQGFINLTSPKEEAGSHEQSANPISPAVTTICTHNNPPAFLNNLLIHIRNFLAIPGNPFQPIEVIQVLKENGYSLPPNLIDQLFNQNVYKDSLSRLRRLNRHKKSESQEDLSTDQTSSSIQPDSSNTPPNCSGRKPRMLPILNYHEQSHEQNSSDPNKSKKANIPQVTDKMETIEDDCSELDVKITRNKNVYRKLKLYGYEYAIRSPMLLEELKEIYGERGWIFIALMPLRPDLILSKILTHLKERMIDLYIEKVSRMMEFATKFESVVPTQRVIYQLSSFERINQTEIEQLKCEKLQYPINQVHLLHNFLSIVKSNISSENPELDFSSLKLDSCFQTILSELRSPSSSSILMTYYHAFSIYTAALFLTKVCSTNVIDSVEGSNVKMAIELGLTEFSQHGYQKIVNVAANSIYQKKTKMNCGEPETEASMEISGRFFEIDAEKSNEIVQLARLFFTTLVRFSEETSLDPAFIVCSIENGQIQLLSNDNETIIMAINDT